MLGTVMFKKSLRKIGAHSSIAPADVESIIEAMDAYNALIQEWESDGMKPGWVPITTPAQETSVPLDIELAVIDNLALVLAPNYGDGNVPVELKNSARRGKATARAKYRELSIPDKVVSSTLPKGEGHSRNISRDIFFGEGGTIEN